MFQLSLPCNKWSPTWWHKMTTIFLCSQILWVRKSTSGWFVLLHGIWGLSWEDSKAGNVSASGAAWLLVTYLAIDGNYCLGPQLGLLDGNLHMAPLCSAWFYSQLCGWISRMGIPEKTRRKPYCLVWWALKSHDIILKPFQIQWEGTQSPPPDGRSTQILLWPSLENTMSHTN